MAQYKIPLDELHEDLGIFETDIEHSGNPVYQMTMALSLQFAIAERLEALVEAIKQLPIYER